MQVICSFQAFVVSLQNANIFLALSQVGIPWPSSFGSEWIIFRIVQNSYYQKSFSCLHKL